MSTKYFIVGVDMATGPDKSYMTTMDAARHHLGIEESNMAIPKTVKLQCREAREQIDYGNCTASISAMPVSNVVTTFLFTPPEAAGFTEPEMRVEMTIATRDRDAFKVGQLYDLPLPRPLRPGGVLDREAAGGTLEQAKDQLRTVLPPAMVVLEGPRSRRQYQGTAAERDMPVSTPAKWIHKTESGGCGGFAFSYREDGALPIYHDEIEYHDGRHPVPGDEITCSSCFSRIRSHMDIKLAKDP
jgi:hypothetical protein